MYRIRYVIIVHVPQVIIMENVVHTDHDPENAIFATVQRKHRLRFVAIAESHRVITIDNVAQ